jgi:hypothetical protein
VSPALALFLGFYKVGDMHTGFFRYFFQSHSFFLSFRLRFIIGRLLICLKLTFPETSPLQDEVLRIIGLFGNFEKGTAYRRIESPSPRGYRLHL